MPTLFIRALSTPQPVAEGLTFRCEWLILDASGHREGQGGGEFLCPAEPRQETTPFWKNDAPAEAEANGGENNHDWVRNPTNVVVFVPAEQVLSVACEVPGRNTSQIRRALPYVVEEFIAGDIDRTHLANSALRRGQPIHCGIIDEHLLRNWLACLAGLGIRPGYLHSEAEMLPVEPRAASLLVENGQALLRTQSHATSIDRGNLVPVLNTLDLDRLTLVDGQLNDIEAGQLNLEISANETSALAREGGVLAYFAEQWRAPGKPLNLLQGEYAAELPRNIETRRWRGAAWLGAVWLALGFVGMLVAGIWSSRQADALEAEALSIYRGIFPQDRTATVQNIRRRMQAQLGERAVLAGRSMIDFAGDIAAVMQGSMALMGIDYNEARGEFATEILVRRYDDVERVREALEERGVTAEITSAEQVEEGVQARLRVRAD